MKTLVLDQANENLIASVRVRRWQGDAAQTEVGSNPRIQNWAREGMESTDVSQYAHAHAHAYAHYKFSLTREHQPKKTKKTRIDKKIEKRN